MIGLKWGIEIVLALIMVVFEVYLRLLDILLNHTVVSFVNTLPLTVTCPVKLWLQYNLALSTKLPWQFKLKKY